MFAIKHQTRNDRNKRLWDLNLCTKNRCPERWEAPREQMAQNPPLPFLSLQFSSACRGRDWQGKGAIRAQSTLQSTATHRHPHPPNTIHVHMSRPVYIYPSPPTSTHGNLLPRATSLSPFVLAFAGGTQALKTVSVLVAALQWLGRCDLHSSRHLGTGTRVPFEGSGLLKYHKRNPARAHRVQ